MIDMRLAWELSSCHDVMDEGRAFQNAKEFYKNVPGKSWMLFVLTLLSYLHIKNLIMLSCIIFLFEEFW
jgi:hypothetical protein